MTTLHSKVTVTIVNSVDLSTFCNAQDPTYSADSHDLTTHGRNGHVFREGLTNGTVTIGGNYDSTAGTGPRAVLRPLIGAAPVPVQLRPEGTGSGLPQDSFDAQVTSYTESNPVAGYKAWTANLQISGDVDSDPQA